MSLRVVLVLGLLALVDCERGASALADAGLAHDAQPRDASATRAAKPPIDAPPLGSGWLPLVPGQAANRAASAHPGTLRIVDWNIKAGRGSSINTIAMRLAALEPDIVVLQEVDSKTTRSGGVDQPALLSEMLQFDYVFAPTIPWSGGTYGIATLSRFPFSSAERILLTNMFVGEKRTALDSLLCVEDTVCLHVINHHADVELAAAVLSTQEILDHVQLGVLPRTTLFADLNQVPSDPGPQACVAAGLFDVGHAFGDAVTEGGRRIDYAFVENALMPCVKQMTVNSETSSDHNSLVVDFDSACLAAHAM